MNTMSIKSTPMWTTFVVFAFVLSGVFSDAAKISGTNRQTLSFDWTNALRSCQQRGQEVRVAEIAVEYDSFYCSEYGGNNAAATEMVIKEAVRNATFPYMTQFCMRLEVVKFVGHCNDPTDPFIGQVNGASLETINFLMQRWADLYRNVHRDVAFLFTGQRSGTAAGAAYRGSMCSSLGYGFVRNRSPINIAHEIGHTLGAIHLQREQNGIMNPAGAIGSGPFLFTSASVNTINEYLVSSDGSCVATGTHPTVSATASPSVSATPSDQSVPPEGWTCSPWFYNTDDGCDCGCGVRDPDCNRTNPGLLYCNPRVENRDLYKCNTVTNTCVMK